MIDHYLTVAAEVQSHTVLGCVCGEVIALPTLGQAMDALIKHIEDDSWEN